MQLFNYIQEKLTKKGDMFKSDKLIHRFTNYCYLIISPAKPLAKSWRLTGDSPTGNTN